MPTGLPIDLGRGWRHLALTTVGSTNVECFAQAAHGAPGGLWITAERQMSGRGRRGRIWISEAGNLYASVLLIDPAPASRLGQMPLVAAVALQDAAGRASEAWDRLKIKWPNDLLFDALKVSGILLESQVLPDRRLAVVIGFGVNCRHAPEGTELAATSFAAGGIALSADHLFMHLVDALDEWLRRWNRGEGFAAIRNRWLEAAIGLGAPIRVRLHDRELQGRFVALDADGQLILELSEGYRETITAGDVFLLEGHKARDLGFTHGASRK